MARGTSLGELVNQLRLEAKLDSNPALSLNLVPTMKQLLKRTQERLYDDFDWPFLKVTRDKVLEAGSRYYDLPADMNLERVHKVDYRYQTQWDPVERGIELCHYNDIDSDAGAQRDPVERWDVSDTGTGVQVEVWPIPVSNGGTLRFRGIRNLTPLISDSDIADLDDQLIVLYASATMLARDPVAELKLGEARSRFKTLTGRSIKTRNNSFTLGGSADESRDRVIRGSIIS